MTYSELSYESILRTIYAWPAAKRYLLIQDLLRTLEPKGPESEPSATLSLALGLLATDQPAPSDEDVTRWLNERRSEKYG